MTYTDSELELLHMLEQGLSAKEIAVKRDCTVTAVERSIQKLRDKHQCRNSIQLVAQYLRHILTPRNCTC